MLHSSHWLQSILHRSCNFRSDVTCFISLILAWAPPEVFLLSHKLHLLEEITFHWWSDDDARVEHVGGKVWITSATCPTLALCLCVSKQNINWEEHVCHFKWLFSANIIMIHVIYWRWLFSILPPLHTSNDDKNNWVFTVRIAEWGARYDKKRWSVRTNLWAEGVTFRKTFI